MKHIWKKALAAITAVTVLAVPVYAQEGGLSLFDGIGKESNQITTPQALYSDNGNLIALDDIGISVIADGYTTIRQSDGFVYIYTQDDGSIPYVIIGRYDIASDDFANAFTAYMAGSYSDLRVTQDSSALSIAGKIYTKIVYEYAVGGYTVQDTRLFSASGNFTYMFGAKEVPALAYYVGDGYLEQVAGSYAMLAGGDSDYENHVDSTRSVEGNGPSVADLGGFGTDVTLGGTGNDSYSGGASTDDSGTDEGSIVGTTVGDAGSVAGSEASSVLGSITFDESVADYNGVWVPFDDGFKLYLPAEWNTYIVSEEQQANGCLYQAGDASGTNANAPYIAVNYGATEGLATLDEISDALAQAGYTIDGKISVNGLECVSYTMPSNDLAGLIFFYPYSKDYMFAVVAYNYSYNDDTQAAILCSLSPNM